MNIKELNEDAALKAVHNAVMNGLERANIRYESDGETYWINFKNTSLYVEIGFFEN